MKKNKCCRCNADISNADFFGYCKSCVSSKGAYALSDRVYVCHLWTYIYVENSNNRYCIINSDLIYELIRKVNIDSLEYDSDKDIIYCGSEQFKNIVERISGGQCVRNQINSFDFRINNKF